MTEKIFECEHCGSEFERIGKRGPYPRFCPDCKSWSKRNPEASKKHSNAYYRRNREACCSKMKEWRGKNPEYMSSYFQTAARPKIKRVAEAASRRFDALSEGKREAYAGLLVNHKDWRVYLSVGYEPLRSRVEGLL